MLLRICVRCFQPSCFSSKLRTYRRCSAALATMISGKGSSKSPITYFSISERVMGLLFFVLHQQELHQLSHRPILTAAGPAPGQAPRAFPREGGLCRPPSSRRQGPPRGSPAGGGSGPPPARRSGSHRHSRQPSALGLKDRKTPLSGFCSKFSGSQVKSAHTG